MNTQDATTRIATHFEAFDRSLKAGSIVEVRWTNSHRYYAARGEVVKINAKSLRVRLLEAVTGVEGDIFVYPVGRTIVVPRQYQARWSANNGVFPLPVLQGILIDDKGVRVASPPRSDTGIRAVLNIAGDEPIGQHEFYVSSHPPLLVGSQFVALQDGCWSQKQLPIYEPAIPLRGPLFIVHRPAVQGGYWLSLSSTDIAAFQRLFGVPVSGVS